MSEITENLTGLQKSLAPGKVTLVAVSKTQTVENILELYNSGQRDFGENRVQELIDKKDRLPEDIHWHLIGHLQRNKVKYISSFIYLIHSVDSLRLLEEINAEALKNNRVINCLLQVYVATEETKFGLHPEEAATLLASDDYNVLKNIKICGIMGMASNSTNEDMVREEFGKLRHTFDLIKENFFPASTDFNILSMGMSGDYKLAIEEGSNMVRLGSVLFGQKVYHE
jgi:pyridoxal phosphate enzyme (YggS family)